MKTTHSLLSTLFCLLLFWTVSCKKEEPTVTPGTTNPGSGTGTTGTTKSSAKAITKFSFAALSPAIDATIDATSKTISATVTSGTDVTKLVPTITLSDKATVSPASGIAQDFSKAVTYTVTAEDGSTQAYTASVAKEVMNAGGTTVTFTEKQGTIPTITDMKRSTPSSGILFALNSKLYYLGCVEVPSGYGYSSYDFKYFFEYDPSSDKWTRKEDFPFKHNLDGNNEGSAWTSFVHNGKVFITSSSYSFFSYDPSTNKWTNENFGFYSLSNDWTSYNGGMLYGVLAQLKNTFVVDITNKAVKNYPMKEKHRFNAGTTFFANKKLYSVATTGLLGGDLTGKLEVFEVDYLNGNYIAKSSFEAFKDNFGYVSRIRFTSQLGNKMYFFFYEGILIYDAATDKWEKLNKSNSGGGGLTATIDKTIYSMSDGYRLVAIQTP